MGDMWLQAQTGEDEDGQPVVESFQVDRVDVESFQVDRMDEASTGPAVMVRPITYEVSLLPVGNINRGHYAITVEWRGGDRWAVLHHGFCLSVDREWDYEMSVSNREDPWLDEHRFSLDVALRLAREAAPGVEVGGRTAAQVVALHESREC